jgi:hypothetical protein
VVCGARPWYLGGFSALYPLDSSGRSFVTVTDRGPNDDITCNAVAGKVIFVPAFAPRLIYFTVKDGKIKLDKVKPMRASRPPRTRAARASSGSPTSTARASCT